MRLRYIYSFLALLFFGFGFSQQSKIRRGATDFDNFAYVNVIKTYERIVERGFKSEEVLRKLADAYYFRGELPEAAKWYGELYTMNPELSAEHLYRYAQSLRAIENYTLSDQMMVQFKDKNGADHRALRFKNNTDYLQEIKNNSGRYKLQTLDINTQYSDYGSAFYKDQMVFTSARDTGSLSNRKHKWTGEGFTDLYTGVIDTAGMVSDVKRFDKQIKSKFHESTPAFSKDGKTVYFTRNNYLKGKRGKSTDRITLLKIYRASLDDKGRWSNIEELPFNSDDYSVAHPALSPDEQYLYFASDMPGTLGKSDLFKVKINADGSFGTPENLGPKINTEGRESFPFIASDSIVYFATDGYPGLGGLDVFAFKIKEDGSYTDPQNIGADINTPMDDFGYIINTESKIGFFSSNKPGGQGSDDVYGFKELESLVFECEQTLKGTVRDKDTGEPIAGAELVLYDSDYKEVTKTQSNADGYYDFGKVECDQKMRIRASKEEYNTEEQTFVIPDSPGETTIDVALELTEKPFKVDDNIGGHFDIIIYFDLDKWNIRPDAAVELAKIVDVMQQYPTLEIDVRSHTDSRASHRYNERLSDRRAKSTIKWMVAQGISKERLTGKGYGETQLVNECADGVECTEEQHQLNRRSEFIVKKL